jgi:hypothetical protein
MLVEQVAENLTLLREKYIARTLFVLQCWYQEESEQPPNLEMLVYGNSIFSTSLYETFIWSFQETRIMETVSRDESATLFFDHFDVLCMDVVEDCAYLLQMQELFFGIDTMFFHLPIKKVW